MRHRSLAASTRSRNVMFLGKVESQYFVGASSPSGHSISSHSLLGFPGRGCHSFGTLPPFSLGNSILGYGMSLASAAAVGPNMDRRSIAVMGDGGFWHNGLITGVASNLFNHGDGILIVMQNGYTSATGQQYMPSSPAGRSGKAPRMDVETTLRSMGVKWLRKVRTYSVATMMATIKEAMRSAENGLKVIIADGECQLARQRRVRAAEAEK